MKEKKREKRRLGSLPRAVRARSEIKGKRRAARRKNKSPDRRGWERKEARWVSRCRVPVENYQGHRKAKKFRGVESCE